MVDAYAHLAGRCSALTGFYGTESAEEFEVSEIGDVNAWQSWLEDRATREAELIAGVRKAVIALSAAQALAEERAKALQSDGLLSIVLGSGKLARGLITTLDEERISQVAETSLADLERQAGSLSRDLGALIATAGHAPIPASAFATVGEEKGALVPLLEAVMKQISLMIAGIPALETSSRPTEPRKTAVFL